MPRRLVLYWFQIWKVNNEAQVISNVCMGFAFSEQKSIYMFEWVINANSAIFQLYHGQYKLIFNEMMMRSTLY